MPHAGVSRHPGALLPVNHGNIPECRDVWQCNDKRGRHSGIVLLVRISNELFGSAF